MARHKKLATPDPRRDAHPTYAALSARLSAFQSELSAQAKSRATQEAPAPTTDMASQLIVQMARLMIRSPEARGLPKLPTDRPVSFSELSVAFAQTHHAFTAFGQRLGYDKPVADAESERRTREAHADLIRMMNVRIIMGIRTGYLVPTGDETADAEKSDLAAQFMHLVDRLGLLVDETTLPDPNEQVL